MKQIIFSLAAVVMLNACAQRNQDVTATAMVAGSESTATPAVPTSNTQMDPTTVQLIDSVYDFGNIVDGAVVQYSYRFKNAGTKPLVISTVSASCGCTVPEKPEQPILPGETGYIKVKFDSKGRVGETHKTIQVMSNASPAFPELLLKGQVKSAG